MVVESCREATTVDRDSRTRTNGADPQDVGERPAPLLREPRLRAGNAQRGATRLELFFDLAYILVIAELAKSFTRDLTWHGAAVFTGLFAVTWWSWVTITLYANRFDTNDVVYRLAKLGGTVAVIGMAASAGAATSEVGGTRFAVCYLATRVLLLGLYGWAYRAVREARPTIVVYLCGTGVGALLWAASLPLDGMPRYLLWGAGLLMEASGPIVATWTGRGVPLHLEHLPERFALFVILVLGESIASIVHGLYDKHWQGGSVAAALVGFVALAALWWSYFDLGGAAGRHRLMIDGADHESGVADAYVYGHLPVTLGLAVFAVGLGQFVKHPGGLAPEAGRWALDLGVVLFLAGTAAVLAGTSRDLRAAWPWPILAVPAVLLVGVPNLPALLSVGVVAVVLVVTVVAGVLGQRRGELETGET